MINVYDKESRRQIRDLDQAVLAQLLTGSMKSSGVKVVTNTNSKIYFVIPEDARLSDLSGVQAAGGPMSTASTICSSASSASSYYT